MHIVNLDFFNIIVEFNEYRLNILLIPLISIRNEERYYENIR